jgi:hypothetical protein
MRDLFRVELIFTDASRSCTCAGIRPHRRTAAARRSWPRRRRSSCSRRCRWQCANSNRTGSTSTPNCRRTAYSPHRLRSCTRPRSRVERSLPGKFGYSWCLARMLHNPTRLPSRAQSRRLKRECARTVCMLLRMRKHVSTHAWIGHIGALVHAAHVTVRRKRCLRYRPTTHSCYGASAADGGIVPPAGLKEGAVAAAPADVKACEPRSQCFGPCVCMYGRTSAQRLRVDVGRAGGVRVVVDAAGDGVPIATVRVVRVRQTAAVRHACRVGRALARVRGVEPSVLRRARIAAAGAEQKCCTARRAAVSGVKWLRSMCACTGWMLLCKREHAPTHAPVLPALRPHNA